MLLSRRLEDPLEADPTRPFDAIAPVLSAVGMFCIVFGILQAGSNNALLAIFLVIGAAFMLAFFLFIRSRERAGKEALLSTGLFKNRTCNLALVTQNIQWLVLLGRLRLSAGGSRLQRDQDGRRLHRGDARHPRLVPRRRATR